MGAFPHWLDPRSNTADCYSSSCYGDDHWLVVVVVMKINVTLMVDTVFSHYYKDIHYFSIDPLCDLFDFKLLK